MYIYKIVLHLHIKTHETMTPQNLDLTKWASAMYGQNIGSGIKLVMNLAEGNTIIMKEIKPANHTLALSDKKDQTLLENKFAQIVNLLEANKSVSKTDLNINFKNGLRNISSRFEYVNIFQSSRLFGFVFELSGIRLKALLSKGVASVVFDSNGITVLSTE